MVVTTGFFDGVHLGHRQVIERLVSVARERDTESLVITFWPHPRTALQSGAKTLRLLSTLEEKKIMLQAMGVDRVEVISFTKGFASLSAEEYLRDYVRDRYDGEAIVLGYDNRMGCAADGAVDIGALASGMGLDVLRTEPFLYNGAAVSSTRIRAALASGDVAGAAGMLGYDYSMKGVVVAGDGIGRTLGFPTANMQLYDPLKAVPANGVYMTEVMTEGRFFHGITNIGLRPTLGKNTSPVIETHILDFDEEIYGLDIRLSFVRKIRDEIRFDSLDSLKSQLQKDREVWC